MCWASHGSSSFAADFKNVSIVGHYIKERTKNAQFVIISLRNNMFELADRLVGIYKVRGKSLSEGVQGSQPCPGSIQSWRYGKPFLTCMFADRQHDKKRSNQSR